MHKPFFSIIIPTFNRSEDLRFAIFCVLKQKFTDFELIIADDASSENIKKIVNAFKDKRLVYFKNKKNLWWIENTKKAIKKAKGEYLILHGNDDFIINDNFLQDLRVIIKKNKPGFLRVNYLTLSPNKTKIVNYIKLPDKDRSIYKNNSNAKIIDYIQKTDPFFISGLVFKNDFGSHSQFITSEFAPWFNVVFNMVKKYGGHYVSKPYFVSSWSKNPIHPFNYLLNGKFSFEEYFESVKLLDKNKFRLTLHRELSAVVSVFPLTKLKKGNGELVKCAKRVITLDNKYLLSPIFWLYFISSLILPRAFFAFIRNRKLSEQFNNLKSETDAWTTYNKYIAGFKKIYET